MVQTQCHTGHSHDLSAFAHVWWSFSSQQHLTGKYISQFTVTIQTTFINVCVLQWSNAAADCTAAIGIDAVYLKAYMRRATAYEQSDDLERALTDLKKVRKLTRGVNRVTLDAVLLPAQRMPMRWCALGRLKTQQHMQATPEPEPGKGLSHLGEHAHNARKAVHLAVRTSRIHNVQVVELDPGNAAAVAKAAKLEPVVLERREKMKEEMIGADQDPRGRDFGLRSCWSRQRGTIYPAPSQQRDAPVGSARPHNYRVSAL